MEKISIINICWTTDTQRIITIKVNCCCWNQIVKVAYGIVLKLLNWFKTKHKFILNCIAIYGTRNFYVFTPFKTFVKNKLTIQNGWYCRHRSSNRHVYQYNRKKIRKSNIRNSRNLKLTVIFDPTSYIRKALLQD